MQERLRNKIKRSPFWASYNTHGHKLRFPPYKKAQFVTECGITVYFFYGLSFFCMGLAVILEVDRSL